MATSAPASAKPVTDAGKAGAIGIVKLVVGVVTATDQSGAQRVLAEGDRVNANDVIQTSAAGAVDIQFSDNTHLDLGRASQIALDSSVFDPRQAATDQADVAAIQAAIAAGADPTTLVPATAAGAGGGADEGGSSFVVVDQNAARGNVTSGFDTGGGFAPPPVVLLQQAGTTQPTEPVSPPELIPPVTPGQIATPPAVVGDSVSTPEDQAITGSVAVNDTPGSAGGNVWSLESGATNGTVVVNADGTFTYTPNANYNGPDSFTYTLKDADGNATSATVNVAVTPVNDAPVAVNDGFTTNEDTVLTGATVLANDTDVDGNALNAVLLTQAAHGTVAFNPDGTFTYTPNANYNGPDSFTYKANDGTADSNVATVNITVGPVNDAPVAVNDGFTTNEDTVLTGATVLANDTDVDGNVLNAVLLTQAAHGTVAFNPDGTFTYTPNANYNGPDSFTYKANDGTADSNVATVNITVGPVNDAPVAVNDGFTTNEDTVLTGATVLANDTDVDGNVLNAVLLTQAAHGTVAFNPDGTFTYTPNANYNGPDSFTYKANDGTADSNVATVNITVGPVNDLPVGIKEQFSVTAGSTLSVAANKGVLANDSDIETPRSSLTAVVESNVEHGSLALNPDGAFVYTPQAGFAGTDSFTYRADDGTGRSAPVTVTLSVDPLVAAGSASVTGTEDSPLGIRLSGSETGGHVDSFVITSLPQDGHLFLANGSTPVRVGMTITAQADQATLTFKPDANESGGAQYAAQGVGDQHATYASFTYVSNGTADTSTPATISVTITPVSDPVVLQVGTQAILSHADTFDAGTASGWIASNTITGATGAIEIQNEPTYGGISATNFVLEVESNTGVNSLHQAFATTSGAVYQLDVDFSARTGHAGADSTLQVLVNGEVIGTMPGAATFGFQHHVFSFAGSGGADLVEFRALDGQVNTFGGLLDNIVLKQVANAYEGHAALLPPIVATFGDVLDHSEQHVIQLNGLATGTVVSDGMHQFSATPAVHALEILNADNPAGNWNLTTLSVTAPAGFAGTTHVTATATATEAGGVPAATASHEFTLSYGATSFTGSANTDILHGSTVNDIINGGPGDDILSGSLGSNTFVYRSGDLQAGAAGDHILDFKVATSTQAGDVLDISDLLSGAQVAPAAFAGHEADFLKVTSTGGNTTVQIDLDGTGPVAAVPVVTLDGVTATLDSLLGHNQIHGV